MGASGVFVELDHRNRVALGKYARGHTQFLLSVDDQGTIHLTPAAVTPLPVPPPVVRRRSPRKATVKKAAAAAAEKSQE